MINYQMGTKVAGELLSTVRSIVGQEFSDMDIMRALHMAKHDPTAAINIIFDTPNFKTPEKPSIAARPTQSPTENENLSVTVARAASNNAEEMVSEGPKQNGNVNGSGGVGSEWWFVGLADVAGMSTCKGRKLKYGDEVTFSFPRKSTLSSPLQGKGVFGRGRPAAAACSEIVRFSTKSAGEVV